jgi:hypothetical protein
LIVKRHRQAATIATSNRDPIEWLGQMADALLAQSAIDRLQSSAYELVPRRPKLPEPPEANPEPAQRADPIATPPPRLTPHPAAAMIATSTLAAARTRSHATGEEVVPSRWRATGLTVVRQLGDAASPNHRLHLSGRPNYHTLQ